MPYQLYHYECKCHFSTSLQYGSEHTGSAAHQLTDQRPGIVVWSNTTQEVWVFELTVCFESGYEEARTWKTDRYTDLMEQIAEASSDDTRGWKLQVLVSSKLPRLLECSKKQWEAFLINVVQTTSRSSHKIRVTRNWTDSDGGGEKEIDHDTCTLCGELMTIKTLSMSSTHAGWLET